MVVVMTCLVSIIMLLLLKNNSRHLISRQFQVAANEAFSSNVTVFIYYHDARSLLRFCVVLCICLGAFVTFSVSSPIL